VFGSKAEFDNCAKYIVAGRQKNASRNEKERASKIRAELQDLAQPYFLQRTVQEKLRHKLPPKKEFVVCLNPSPAQRSAYTEFLKSDAVATAKLSDNRICALAAITRLRMICCHPFFAKDRKYLPDSTYLNSHEDEFYSQDEEIEVYLKERSAEEIMEGSVKLRFCLDILQMMIAQEHKTLVFSESRKQLDFLTYVLEQSGVKVFRVDGPTPPKKRERYMKEFNQDASSRKVMLLTVKVGGLGLTLTGADRVIILGPSWNPTVDEQAVGRSYRIGQTIPVKTYRLVLAGTVEEKVGHLLLSLTRKWFVLVYFL
jgi:SNF2 family DNA or RNA helicase